MVDARDQIVTESLAGDDVSVEVNEEKLGELLLLVAEELREDRFGGATKINKVMFFAEFSHMRLTGQPITGAAYQKLTHGPAPRRLRPVRERLITSGRAALVTETVLGYEQHRLRPNRPANRAIFTDTELEAIADAVALLKGRTAAEASSLSHEEPGWRLVDYGEDIPFIAASVDPDQTRSSPRIR